MAVSDKPRAPWPIASLGEWGRIVVTALNWLMDGSPYPVCTVADLPTGEAGDKGFVTDATSTTFAATATGGGANAVPVYHDGAGWRVG